MTPADLAALHRAAFLQDRSWSAEEFASLLASPFVTLHDAPHGFALTRTVAGESELLTLAVDPAHQGQGIGRALLRRWIAAAAPDAQIAFLEVASDNTAAVPLYLSEGFTEVARRGAYYLRKNAAAADAIVMQRALTLGHTLDSSPLSSESG